MRLQEFVEDEVFSPTLIAGALWTTKSEIASTLGLGQDARSPAPRGCGLGRPRPGCAR